MMLTLTETELVKYLAAFKFPLPIKFVMIIASFCSNYCNTKLSSVPHLSIIPQPFDITSSSQRNNSANRSIHSKLYLSYEIRLIDTIVI